MRKLKLLVYPDKNLRTYAPKVLNIDYEIKEDVSNMIYTMEENSGIGLAANQVGILKRIIVFNNNFKRKTQVLINPEIVSTDGNVISEGEGCLSLPYLRCDVMRHRKIGVSGLDIEGKDVFFECNGMTSITIQHEIDHLNGKLLLDKISNYKRDRYKKYLDTLLDEV